jgi:hypothetical protein
LRTDRKRGELWAHHQQVVFAVVSAGLAPTVVRYTRRDGSAATPVADTQQDQRVQPKFLR